MSTVPLVHAHCLSLRGVARRVVSWLLGALLVVSFPLWSLSTGELKPRGAFIAENALHTHLANQRFDAKHVRAHATQ